MKFLKALTALALLAASFPLAAPAQDAAGGVYVTNKSDRDVWVTFYRHSGRDGKVAYGCVRAGKKVSFSTNLQKAFGGSSGYYVLAEVKNERNNSCKGSNYSEVQPNQLRNAADLTISSNYRF